MSVLYRGGTGKPILMGTGKLKSLTISEVRKTSGPGWACQHGMLLAETAAELLRRSVAVGVGLLDRERSDRIEPEALRSSPGLHVMGQAATQLPARGREYWTLRDRCPRNRSPGALQRSHSGQACGRGPIGRRTMSRRYSDLNSATRAETVALASPNSIRVFGLKNSGFSTPANPGRIERFNTMQVRA